MLEKYLDQTIFTSTDDFKKNFHVKIPDNFNFAYDVVDEWAKTNPEKTALLWTNEQSEIAQGIDKVDAARERNIAQQAVEGARLNRVGITYERNLDLAIANTKAQSKIEDVDLATIMSEWSMADAVYNSSLKTAATLMNRSLMDYL